MSDTPPNTAFISPERARYFEDYVVGDVHELGAVSADEAEVVEFATKFDPQIIHTDPDKARDGPFGGVIASGWHTAGLMMSLYARHYLSDVSSLASPGMERLNWFAPVRPGDQLSVRVSVVDAKRSRSKPDRGIVRSEVEVRNQADVVVMSMLAVNMISCRDAG